MKDWVHRPPDLEPVAADNLTVRLNPDETVSLLFWRSTSLDEYPAPDDDLDTNTLGIIVADITYSRERFRNLPDVLRAIIDGTGDWTGTPDEGPDNPGT